MTRDKPNSQFHCMIVDLSWCQGASVNSSVDKDKFLYSHMLFNYPSVDNVIDKVTQLGEGSTIYKVAVSRAFRQT